MDSWDEVRTAYHVARAGTVSGAAEALGVHHATVIRHIDALEGRLGVKLFQRHARGYTATEAGADLLQVAQATEDQFIQLAGRIKGLGSGVSGDLVITSLADVADLIAPVLTDYQKTNPEVRVQYVTGERLFRLEYGEAHVAIRAGGQPDQPDNVVQQFSHLRVAMVASKEYLDAQGRPGTVADLKKHRFVGHFDESNRAPFHRWLLEQVGADRVTFRTADMRVARLAVEAGAGIGFFPARALQRFSDLEEVLPSQDNWSVPLWLVTHVDLHRTAKVQSVLEHLKEQARGWDAA